ncbi:uncharacterized protein LOC134764418 [Penaeus indicus]|uniref:uncharacterized protein LOC125029117 n=1 Tax=Penaeus chinensis TaxID=139456 RepID=UPI001FB710AA|nr:uncharacterized protein LOC125029117 [Penaeus chinensis]
MLLNPDMLPQQDGAMSIEPQYDGVIMLSPEAVLFSDAKPRPDGRKVYHVFERTPGDGPRDEAAQNDDFRSRREQLFSQAHENTIHNIQQVLAESGLVNQDWCEGSLGDTAEGTPVAPTNNHSTEVHNITQTTQSNANTQTCLDHQLQPPPRKLHQFEMVFPIEPYSCVQKRRLLRRLRRKGVGQVELEPENHRINVTTRRSANVILSVLRGVDPNARLLGTFRETLIEDNIDPDSVEVVDGL